MWDIHIHHCSKVQNSCFCDGQNLVTNGVLIVLSEVTMNYNLDQYRGTPEFHKISQSHNSQIEILGDT